MRIPFKQHSIPQERDQRLEISGKQSVFRRMEPSEYSPDKNSSDQDLSIRKYFNSSGYSRRFLYQGRSSLSFLRDFAILRQFPDTLPLPLLKLRFINSPPPCIFTDSRIEAEDGSPIAIELVDADTNTRVNWDTRLEIVALNADITEESLTTEDFNRSILQSRERRRPLLVGDLTVTLKDGFGVIGSDIVFTDNSSWLKNKKFRLGAKAMEEGGGFVLAITEAFMCKDHRGSCESIRTLLLRNLPVFVKSFCAFLFCSLSETLPSIS